MLEKQLLTQESYMQSLFSEVRSRGIVQNQLFQLQEREKSENLSSLFSAFALKSCPQWFPVWLRTG